MTVGVIVGMLASIERSLLICSASSLDLDLPTSVSVSVYQSLNPTLPLPPSTTPHICHVRLEHLRFVHYPSSAFPSDEVSLPCKLG